MSRVQHAMLAVAIGALAACGRPDAQAPPASRPEVAAPAPARSPAESAESLASDIEARRPTLIRAQGNTVAGDASSQWTAYYAGQALLLIDDSVSLGDYGDSRVRFYYDQGRLRLYREDGRRVNMGRDARGSRVLATRIVFDEQGAVVASSYQVDGQDSTLPVTKADEARNRSADLLRRLVRR